MAKRDINQLAKLITEIATGDKKKEDLDRSGDVVSNETDTLSDKEPKGIAKNAVEKRLGKK